MHVGDPVPAWVGMNVRVGLLSASENRYLKSPFQLVPTHLGAGSTRVFLAAETDESPQASNATARSTCVPNPGCHVASHGPELRDAHRKPLA